MYQFSGIVQVGDAGTSDVQVVPSTLTQEKKCIWWSWSNTGTGCPQKFWSPLEIPKPWPDTTLSSTHCMTLLWVGLDDLQKGLPISAALRF